MGGAGHRVKWEALADAYNLKGKLKDKGKKAQWRVVI